MAISSTLQWYISCCTPVMKSRVERFYSERMIQTYLKLDYVQSQENSRRRSMFPGQAWIILTQLTQTVDLAVSTISYLAFALQLIKGRQSGVLFCFICLALPIFNLQYSRDLYNRVFISHSNNRNYLRSCALRVLAMSERFKQEVFTGNMEGYIKNEFKKNMKVLEDVPEESAPVLYSIQSTPFPAFISQFLGQLPFFYYCAMCLQSPGLCSVSDIAMIQETAASLRSSFDSIVRHQENLSNQFQNIKKLYGGMEGLDSQNSLSTLYSGEAGSLPSEEITKNNGMDITFRNVSFHYPGALAPRLVLRNLTFHIPRSSLVVIVGANGSGKSSVVKLLCNMYQPNSGQILVNGHLRDQYQLLDLKRSVALLSQEHQLLPLTVAENIAVGEADNMSAYEDDASLMDRVRNSARTAGVMDIVQKSEQGWNQEIGDWETRTSYCSHPLHNGPLKDVFDSLENYTGFSGGEKQRIAAARTLMRMSSDKIKLVVADEPTSAMDPEAELELFEALRREQGNRTMVFVTHRFGHLTRHADVILCMKDGELVETGTHVELMKKGGEYAKMYRIQAGAFTGPLNKEVSTYVEDNTFPYAYPLKVRSSWNKL
ncbi:P-loop containing nucleoside triphosphate hydrolase protein [Abortiporus biennis]|nr:P-loop containing nucleoside triphosphate hydrolase protein [Abortiporus biennis]